MEDKERTLYCGNLAEKVTEDLLYELFLQAGPLETVNIPKEKDGRQRNYGFITFKHPVSVPYAIALLSGVSLFGKNLRLDPRGGSDSVPNPYLEQLRQYQMGGYQNNNRNHDNRSRRHDSRRFNVPQQDNKFDSLVNVPQAANMPVLYPGYNQQYVSPHFLQNQMHGPQFTPGCNMSPQNQWPGYR